MGSNYKDLTDSELLQELENEKNDVARYSTQQMAFKVLLNSCYGAIGQQYFRWYDIRQAEAITLSGQLAIKWVAKYLNSYLNEVCETEDEDYVLYIDTDSNYVTLEKLVDVVGLLGASDNEIIDFMDSACEEICKGITKEYERLAEVTNACKQSMDMERENLAMRAFWTRKKRYAMLVADSEGVRYDEPKLKIMGLETARSSTPEPCREKLKEAIKLILTSDEDTVIAFIKGFKKEFFTLPPEKIASSSGVSDVDKFVTVDGYRKGTPIHVRGSIVYNKWVKENKLQNKYEYIRSGDKIKHIYLKKPNGLRENTISFIGKIPKEMDIENYIDYPTQYEKTFLNPLKTILDCIGWQHEKRRGLL